MATIGIADTTFSRFNMGSCAEHAIKAADSSFKIIRYTVPGIKDLPVACKKLLEEQNCDIVLALGMAGAKPIDKQCAHEASLGIQQVQLLTNKHILEVFIHEDEAANEKKLISIFEDRTSKHALNALELLKGKDALTKYAGNGRRQGNTDEGALTATEHFRIGIVVADFNEEITHPMEKIAIEHIKKLGGTHAKSIHVPGSFDMPLAVKVLLERKDVDAVITLGSIIKGSTDHDQVIAYSLAQTLQQLSVQYNKPVTLGVAGPGMVYEDAVPRGSEYATRAVEAAFQLLRNIVYG